MQFGPSLKCIWKPYLFIGNTLLCHYALDALGVPLLCAEALDLAALLIAGLLCSPSPIQLCYLFSRGLVRLLCAQPVKSSYP